jgi:hypothetical protein
MAILPTGFTEGKTFTRLSEFRYDHYKNIATALNW